MTNMGILARRTVHKPAVQGECARDMKQWGKTSLFPSRAV